MKTLSIIAVTFGLMLNSAFAQEQYFQISDDGVYYLVDNGSSKKVRQAHTQPTTTLTFYIEAKRAGILHQSVNYPEFAALTINEQQNLLVTLQGETKWLNYSSSYTEANQEQLVANR